MSKQVKIGNKIIVIMCVVLLIAIGVVIFKANNEIDFNIVTPNNNINTNKTINTLQENVVVDSNIIE